MPSRARLACFAAALAAAVSLPAAAVPERRVLRPDDLYRLREVREPRISPDGEWVAYVVRQRDAERDRKDGDLWMVPSGGGEPVRLTRDPESSDSSPRWSPDGRWLAFLSSRGDDRSQVWRLDRRGGEPEKLTDLPGGVAEFDFSPDGTRLVLVASDPDAPAEKTAAGDAKPRPIVVRRLQFKLDGVGFLDDRRDHLYLFDLGARVAVPLTSGPYDHSTPAWSPDGRWIAFVANRTAEPDANEDTDVWVIEPRPGAEPRRISAPERADSSPAWSPDGSWLTWVEGAEPADVVYGSSRVAVAPPEGGAARPLTAALDRLVYSPRFTADGGGVLFLYEDRGAQPLGLVSLAGEVVEEVVFGDRDVADFDVGPRGELVVAESIAARPDELSRVGPDGLERLTRENDAWLAEIALAAVERFGVTSPDGTEIEAFRYLPPPGAPSHGNPGTPRPALLRLHGGPVAQFSSGFSFELQLMAANGYHVVAPNPRGSSGRGRDFARAIWQDWGNRDTDDVLAAVDHEIAAGLVDGDRMGVFGWSYGGILTNYVITRTGRFKAAMSGASEVNYFSNYGHDHYQRWWEHELGLPWRNPDLWLRLSPFFQVEKVTTPTLVVCGQEDWNVPLVNSEQLYQALRRLGVPTELVIYPGESHSFARPSFEVDRWRRYLAWFERHVLGRAEREPDRQPEATSLLGQPLRSPELPAAARAALEADLAAAHAEFVKAPDSPDTAIWVARRLGYLGRYREAIRVLTDALARHPDDVRILRHRGHRYLTVRELDRAGADLARAAELVRSRNLPDEVEPDGAPNAYGVPTSTTNFNVFYHLGLAHYLRGDFAAAAEAYRAGLAFSQGSNDRLAATTDWLWLALMRLERRDEAALALAAVASDLPVYEDQTYLDRIRLYKGEIGPEQLLAAADGSVDLATRAYAAGVWHLLRGERERARELFVRTLANPQWGAFAVLAAEAELARMEGAR
jgi:dipeptidyl aminopeptidase/acylaminoacyl peptidase/tetratricopeptide (TPR) repeat protein